MAKVEGQNEADSTVYQTEKTLYEHKDKVPAEDVEQIKADIEAVKKAKDDDAVGVDELKEKVEALKKSSMKIGEAMYKNAGDGGGGDAGSGEQKAAYEDVQERGRRRRRRC